MSLLYIRILVVRKSDIPMKQITISLTQMRTFLLSATYRTSLVPDMIGLSPVFLTQAQYQSQSDIYEDISSRAGPVADFSF